MSQASKQESRDSNSGSWLLSPLSRQLYYMSVYKVRRGPGWDRQSFPAPGSKLSPSLQPSSLLWKASSGNQAWDPAIVSPESPDTPPALGRVSPRSSWGCI